MSKAATNPAGRLLKILELARSNKQYHQRPAHDALANILQVDMTEPSRLLREISFSKVTSTFSCRQ
jgi:hypothetical protein